MQTLQRVLSLIKDQLRHLTPQTKLLIGSMMVILVMGLFIVSIYTSRTTMVALPLSRTLPEEARLDAIRYLQDRHIEWTERGPDIYVPIEDRHVILAELTDREIITGDQIDFDTLIQQDSPFISKTQNRQRWLRATMTHLSGMIGRMAGVSYAEVILAEPSGPRGIGRASISPSATVAVRLTSGTLAQTQVDAIAGMVAGAIAELEVEKVKVSDLAAGRLYYPSSPSDIRVGNNLEIQRSIEAHYTEKIRASLDYIAYVRVAVNAVVESKATIERRRSVDEAKQGLTREESRSVESRNQAQASEAGARANTGASLTSGTGGSTSSMTDERSSTDMLPVFGGSESESQDDGGYAKQINATVGIPRSYFVGLFRLQSGDPAAEPTQADLDPIIASERQDIEAVVALLIDTRPTGSPGSVVVRMINDHVLMSSGSGSGGGGGGGGDGDGAGSGVGVGGGAGGFAGMGFGTDAIVKYVSLGGLAFLSMLMMFVMVRKASIQPELPSAEELIGVPPMLEGTEYEVVGEADEGDVPMEGVEVDEESLRRARMLDHINQMATSEPNEAAKLLRRWTKIEH